MSTTRESPYPVRDDLPMPPARAARNKYPFTALAVGKSFFVPLGGAEDDDLIVRRVQGAVTWANRQYKPQRFRSEQITVDGVDGVGVWRTN